MNWDAVVDRKQKMVGVGIIAHDHNGKVLASMCFSHWYISDPTIGRRWVLVKELSSGGF